MFNQKLSTELTGYNLGMMGFTLKQDEDKDPRGNFYVIENDNFRLSIDAWYQVELKRRNPDTDPVILFIETKFDLQCAVDWIAD